MINVPGGTTTISGHVSQSLKVLAARSAASADAANPPIMLSRAAASAGFLKRNRFIQSPWIYGFCLFSFDYLHVRSEKYKQRTSGATNLAKAAPAARLWI
jgi:hypothetical protein